MNRTLIVGWDGAPYDRISQWVKEGKLKNFAALAEKGAFGPLHTTPLTISSCAWTTMFTGKNAGKHGVFDFFGTEFVGGSYFRRPGNAANSESLQGIIDSGFKSKDFIEANLDTGKIGRDGKPMFGAEPISKLQAGIYRAEDLFEYGKNRRDKK